MLLDRLSSDLKNAMREKDAARVRTLRSIRAALQQKEIEKRGSAETAFTEEEVVAVLQKQAKQRSDSIAQYAQAGRDDLVRVEQEELDIIEEYLPDQLDDKDLRTSVERIVHDVGASSMADMGKVMGRAMSELRGRADGRRINEIVKEVLSD